MKIISTEFPEKRNLFGTCVLNRKTRIENFIDRVVKLWHFKYNKSNQIPFIVTSPQHKCLGEWNSYERAPDSAKKNNNRQFTYGQTVQKKQQTIYIWTDSAKKTTNNLHMDRQCKKNNSNLHMDSTYLQTVQKTMCKIHIHILSTHSVL